MINGVEYAWEDIQVVIEGKAVAEDGVTEIKYKTEKNHVEIYGRGADPVALGRGAKKYGSSMTVLQSVLEAMQAGMPAGKDITDRAPFTITCSYAPEGGQAVTDQLTGVRVKSYEKGMKTEDTHAPSTLELAIGKIYYNI